MTIKEWLATQTSRDSSELARLAMHKPILSYTDREEVRTRDKWVAGAEKLVKSIKSTTGISASDTLAEMNTKLTNAITAAAAADKPLLVYKAACFWSAALFLRSIDDDGSDTETVIVHDPVYGDSVAEENGWGSVSGAMIEAAMV